MASIELTLTPASVTESMVVPPAKSVVPVITTAVPNCPLAGATPMMFPGVR